MKEQFPQKPADISPLTGKASESLILFVWVCERETVFERRDKEGIYRETKKERGAI